MFSIFAKSKASKAPQRSIQIPDGAVSTVAFWDRVEVSKSLGFKTDLAKLRHDANFVNWDVIVHLR